MHIDRGGDKRKKTPSSYILTPSPEPLNNIDIQLSWSSLLVPPKPTSSRWMLGKLPPADPNRGRRPFFSSFTWRRSAALLQHESLRGFRTRKAGRTTEPRPWTLRHSMRDHPSCALMRPRDALLQTRAHWIGTLGEWSDVSTQAY